MRKLLLSSVALTILMITPAIGADLRAPVYRGRPLLPPIAVFSWTGCYIGGHIGGGYAWTESANRGLREQLLSI
jgi:outer membrane immunogenic protein